MLIGSQNDEVFDSTASPIDLDEASKRCVLTEKLHLTHFKSFQSKIIDAVLKRKDTLVIQPTGSGKSLCFQFPAVYTKKLTLVITPTISLMQDQTHHLSETGISAIFLGSAQMDAHADSKVFSPDSTVSLLFVSPEWLFNGNDRNLAKVQKLCASGKVCLVAIDEAHLIYDWQDFRQSYKKCEEVHTLFPGVPVMALSATVTPQVHTTLTTILIDPVIETSSVYRSNVFLAAEPCNYKRAEGSKQSISLDSRDFNTFADRVNIISDKCTIVYTDFACHVAPIVLALRDRNIQAVGYYGKMKEGEKQESYFKWKSGEMQAIVATRAFGLGINKPNVRYVICNGLPPSLSAWAQEFGRAGRDGIGRPYMRDYNISPSFTYQFIMSPLMSKLLSEAEFLETDTTYNKNSELMYLFNATVFNYDTMKWAVVARMRGNKEDSGFYKKAFELMFHTCQSYHSNFKVGESLKGIIIDWSDTEAKGLHELLGDNVADKVLKGCDVHWTRSYQWVADKVNNNVHRSNRVLAKEAFCAVGKN